MEKNIHYKLKLFKLHCYVPDEADADEVYLKMNGEKIWPIDTTYVSMKDSTEALDLEFKIEKGSTVVIEVWDYDVLSKNDHLGSVTIVVDRAGGPFNADMEQMDTSVAKYGLEYEVM